MSDINGVAFENLSDSGNIIGTPDLLTIAKNSTLLSTGTTVACPHQSAASSTFSNPSDNQKSLSTTDVTAPFVSTVQTNIATGGASCGSDSALSPSVTSRSLSKTIRLELELFESNTNRYPQFNYTELVHGKKKKFKNKSKLNGFSDPFEENDDDSVRIAQKLEEKYGSGGVAGRSSKRSRLDNCMDIGAGYDESDPFIDNTEAYDEKVPDEMETVFGGFYINSGALQFKPLSNYEKLDDIVKMPKAKKRPLSTSSSSGDDSNENDSCGDVSENVDEDDAKERSSSPKEGSNSSTNTTQNKIKNNHSEKKSKIIFEGANNTESIVKIKNKDKEKKLEKSKPVKDDTPVQEDEVGSDSCNGDDNENEKIVKTVPMTYILKTKRDNYLNIQDYDGKIQLTNGGKVKECESLEISSDETGEHDSGTESNGKKIKNSDDEIESEKLRLNEVKLPPHLTDDLVNNIKEFIDCARLTMGSGQLLHFDEKSINIFLRINESCLRLESTTRNQIFAHLEFELSLAKHTLLRKVKSSRIKQEKIKTKEALTKLKKAVVEIMPSIICTYKVNCKRVDELKSSISPDELQKCENSLKYPMKIFPWNENLRTLLYELYEARRISYAVLRSKGDTYDSFVNNYLRQKVVPVWPSGWMRYEDLQKELDKRKALPRKPKENKKPGENNSSSGGISLLKKRTNDDNNFTSYKDGGGDTSKSILLTNSTLTSGIMKDLVLKINTKSEKKTDVPNLNPSHLPTTSQQQKSHKHEINNTVGSKNCSSIQPVPITNLSSACHKIVHTSSRGNSEKNMHGSNKNVQFEHTGSNSPHGSQTLEMLSPTKKATDHSITSIMSSMTSVLHSDSEPIVAQTSVLKKSPSISISTVTNIADTSKTHIVDLDYLKNTSDIIKTARNITASSGSNSSKTSTAERSKINGNSNNSCSIINSTISKTKEGLLRVRSIASVNNNLEKEMKRDINVVSGVKSNIALTELEIESSSSESDGGVEIIGVFPGIGQKGTATIGNISGNNPVFKKMYKTVSNCENPQTNLTIPSGNKMSTSYNRIKEIENTRSTTGMDHTNYPSTDDDKDAELDVNQIMNSIKELGEMHQSSIRMKNKSPTTQYQSSGSIFRTSPNSFSS